MSMLAPEHSKAVALIRYDSADDYLAAAAPLIAHDIARSAGLRAWIDGLKRMPWPERSFMAIWQASGAAGVAYRRGDQPVSLGDSAAEACVAFADALADENPKLEGVVGKLEACEAFARRWRLRTGWTHKLRHRMRDHVLRTLIAPAAVRGSIRVAGPDDREWLLDMHHAFAADARLTPLAPESARRLVDERLADGGFRIWNDVEDVAFAGYVIAGPDAARIAPVYTRPACRANGYGAAIVGALCAELTTAGRQVFLVTDVSNPTSNALYARLGFVALDDFHAFDLVAPD
jgi:predicted GNAT family acetyltransferase